MKTFAVIIFLVTCVFSAMTFVVVLREWQDQCVIFDTQWHWQTHQPAIKGGDQWTLTTSR